MRRINFSIVNFLLNGLLSTIVIIVIIFGGISLWHIGVYYSAFGALLIWMGTVLAIALVILAGAVLIKKIWE